MSPSKPTRRNGTTTSDSTTSPPTTSPTSPPPTTNPLTALHPTPHETLLLTIYPTLLLLGSLFSLLDPTARAAPYNPITQSHPPSQAPSYFATKHNIFNLYFVKVAWFWITLAHALFLYLHPSSGPAAQAVLTPRRLRALGRWVLVTGWWAVVTQWFFGPALIDRGFTVTGGACRLAESFEGQGGKREFLTGQACKAVGGEWRGGYDISGHVFILVLGSAFLALEVLPALVWGRGIREERRVVGRDGVVGKVEREDVGIDDGDTGGSMWGWVVVGGVVGLCWWMLLMTAAYFHWWFEKLMGLVTAFAGIFVVYFLPRAIPALRDVVGMPGI